MTEFRCLSCGDPEEASDDTLVVPCQRCGAFLTRLDSGEVRFSTREEASGSMRQLRVSAEACRG